MINGFLWIMLNRKGRSMIWSMLNSKGHGVITCIPIFALTYSSHLCMLKIFYHLEWINIRSSSGYSKWGGGCSTMLECSSHSLLYNVLYPRMCINLLFYVHLALYGRMSLLLRREYR